MKNCTELLMHQSPERRRSRLPVIGVKIDVVDWNQAVETITTWGIQRAPRLVAICNTHSIVTAHNDENFRSILNGADLATADGAPVAWLLSGVLGITQERINGPDLMWRVCKRLNYVGAPSIFLFGSTEDTLKSLALNLQARFKHLGIAGSCSPPFRPPSHEEREAQIKQINDSGAGIVWVGLGCPKQEVWMQESKSRLSAVLVGVGAAFDYHSGKLPRAPKWMRSAGLEWLHRASSEPSRLWKRYLYNNTMFIALTLRWLIARRKKE